MSSRKGPIVAKFGGTSVASSQRIKTIVSIVKQHKISYVVVVSAVSGVTDLLLSLISTTNSQRNTKLKQLRSLHVNIINECFGASQIQKDVTFYIDNRIEDIRTLLQRRTFTKEVKDKLVSYGEIMSSYLVSKALESEGVASQQVIATDIIVTNSIFESSDFLIKPTQKAVKKNLVPLLQKRIVPVVTGFIGATREGKTTTLGRGGSDYSASIIGFCLGASEIQIWTDVDGIFSADPRIIKSAQVINSVSYREASELAWFGAKVLHPRTMRPAVAAKIPVKVLNTLKPENPGTLIVEKPSLTHPITAISCKKRITLVNIYSTEMLLSKGFLVKIFEVFAKYDISVDLVSASEVSVSVTLDNDERLSEVIKELSTFTVVSYKKDLGIVSLVGEGIVTSSRTIKDIFDILHSKRILVQMVSLGATNVNVSIVVPTGRVEETVKILHNKLLMALRKSNGTVKYPLEKKSKRASLPQESVYQKALNILGGGV